MKKVIVLTVSESKRLIAKGVVNLSCVRRKLKKGMIAIAKGTTNGYVVEEILGKKIDKLSYVLGAVFPEKRDLTRKINRDIIKEVVLKDGKIVNLSIIDAVKEMRRGDIFVKGGNVLDYERRTAGVLMGSLEGGTIGATLPIIKDKKINLVIPIGLEKRIGGSIYEIRKVLSGGATWRNQPLRLMPIKGTIITEIEALRILTGVKAIQVSAGGVGGAEGSVRLLLEGSKKQIKMVDKILREIFGEPPFIEEDL